MLLVNCCTLSPELLPFDRSFTYSSLTLILALAEKSDPV
jgi:hypothetical protein